jgi:hypothetical protein
MTDIQFRVAGPSQIEALAKDAHRCNRTGGRAGGVEGHASPGDAGCQAGAIPIEHDYRCLTAGIDQLVEDRPGTRSPSVPLSQREPRLDLDGYPAHIEVGHPTPTATIRERSNAVTLRRQPVGHGHLLVA